MRTYVCLYVCPGKKNKERAAGLVARRVFASGRPRESDRSFILAMDRNPFMIHHIFLLKNAQWHIETSSCCLGVLLFRGRLALQLRSIRAAAVSRTTATDGLIINSLVSDPLGPRERAGETFYSGPFVNRSRAMRIARIYRYLSLRIVQKDRRVLRYSCDTPGRFVKSTPASSSIRLTPASAIFTRAGRSERAQPP